MLAILSELRKINKELTELRTKKRFLDYRLILNLNTSVSLYVVSDEHVDISNLIDASKLDIDIEILTQDEMEEDTYYSSVFKKTNTLDFGLRRSLDNLMENADNSSFRSCPVVSVYSYKGGVGRTTALALFSAHYAMHHHKRVFVIDCDFDAPGLINFYDISSKDFPKNGIVEYIKDKEANLNESLCDGYVYEVSSEYSGQGKIHLLSAGNIFANKDRNDYLEALARLDIHGTSVIVEQFKQVILDINKEFSPDVILIDSRAGFNDIFGILVNKISDTFIGFFGNNDQNRPGLHFFIDTLLKNKRNINPIFVLSIITSSFSKKKKDFENEISQYVQTNIEDGAIPPAYPTYCLSRYPFLEDLGTQYRDKEDFIDIVTRKMCTDYLELFEKIEAYIEPE